MESWSHYTILKPREPADVAKSYRPISLPSTVANTSLPAPVVRLLFNYLCGRQTYVDLDGTKSRYRKMKQVVPQSGVLSPILFNLYMSHMPLTPPDISLISYADDCTVFASIPCMDTLCTKLNDYLVTLNDWLKVEASSYLLRNPRHHCSTPGTLRSIKS